MAKLISTLSVGDKVEVPVVSAWQSRFGSKIVFEAADKNHSGYPANSVTLITEKIIQIMASDAKEPNNSNTNRRNYGNNRHIHSNILQWLNSNAPAGNWYSAQHSTDQAPTTKSTHVSYNPYTSWAGFLAMLDPKFVAELLSTTLTVVKSPTDGGSYETFTAKMFLASTTEVGLANENSIAEGSLLALFSNDTSRVAYPTAECVSNSDGFSSGSFTTSNGWYWWLRTPDSSSADNVHNVNAGGVLVHYDACYGNRGIRPLCNLPSSLYITDTPNANGNYEIIYNTAPTVPSSITVPANIFGGRTAAISWGASTDAQNNLSGYALERSVNGGAWTQIYKGANRSYTDTVTFGWNTVQYRVRAYDSYNLYSGYKTSASKTVINNTAPVISGSDSNLGVKTDEFTQNYTVTDVDNQTVTVVEALNGSALRTYTATLGVEVGFAITGTTWLKLPNGTHTFTITATDIYNFKTVRTYTFTKNITSFSIQPSSPMQPASDTMPVRMAISVNRTIPTGAELLVEVCNNANDATPTWEDATDSVTGNLVHIFENDTKTADTWAVSFRVTVNRNGASGACYVTGIEGGFE